MNQLISSKVDWSILPSSPNPYGFTFYTYLEDPPRTCKWLMTLVCQSPKDRVVGPLPNGPNGLYMGLTTYLLSGVILQVQPPELQSCRPPTYTKHTWNWTAWTGPWPKWSGRCLLAGVGFNGKFTHWKIQKWNSKMEVWKQMMFLWKTGWFWSSSRENFQGCNSTCMVAY